MILVLLKMEALEMLSLVQQEEIDHRKEEIQG